MENIIENIEEIRKIKGIKQSVLAEMMGVTQGAYSQYIRRNQDIKYSKIILIANKLGVSVVDIVTYPEQYINVKDLKECESCKEKEKIIKNLNNYIEVLESKLKSKK